MTYLGRQPIFNREGHTFAYELLYRSCSLLNNASFGDGNQATVRVITNIVQNIGVSSILGSTLGFVNVDETVLFNDTLLLLPKEHFWFEILEHTKISLALKERIKELHALGYHFLLDDFACTTENIKNFEGIFPFIEIVKIDVLDIGVERIAHAIELLKPYPNISLLAEKIETFEMYQTCSAYPFSYFQGYFFEKPFIITGKKLEPSTLNALKIMQCIQQDQDPKTVSQKFSMCPDLVYNLLRHINSGAYHFKGQLTNILQMINLLGPKKLLSWLGLFLYGNPESQPFGKELFNNAKFRAKLMESLVTKCGKREHASAAFLTGSLSLIDAYLDITMEEFLREISLDSSIHDALLEHKGLLGDLLRIAKEINHANDISLTIDAMNSHPCFSKEILIEACIEASNFVEDSNQSRKENA